MQFKIQWSLGTSSKSVWYRYLSAVENQCGFGTDTTLPGTGTKMRSLQDFRGISILVQGHARLLVPTSRSLIWIVFKPTLGQN